MKPLDLHSETYLPTGNLAAAGFAKQLGKPRMDKIALLLRETIQNSWDARVDDALTVNFAINLRDLSTEEIMFLRKTVFSELPQSIPLRDILMNQNICTLLISDRGTEGLNGPTRADIVTLDLKDQNFVNFLRNIGRNSGAEYTGGTYGYGKASIYLNSLARTICVHTRCLYGCELQERFIAMGLGPEYDSNEHGKMKRFTGRHWWGSEIDDGFVEPVIGKDASIYAKSLGMPCFKGNETGTDILVIGYDMEEISEEELGRKIVNTILLNAWPKMLPEPTGSPAMKFSVIINGIDIPVPAPEETYPINGFVSAFHMINDSSEYSTYICLDPKNIEINCGSPKKNIGRLAVVKGPLKNISDSSDFSEIFGESSVHHVALMRKPELIIKYMQGPALPSSMLGYWGVFRPFPDLDGAFSMSEPPTHDDWVTNSMEKTPEKTFVNVTLRKIREFLKTYSAPADTDYAAEADIPLGYFSEKLSDLIPGQCGSGVDIQPMIVSRKMRSGCNILRNPQILIEDASELCNVGHFLAIKITFSIRHVQNSVSSCVCVRAGVAVNNGSDIEKAPPVGEEGAKVLQWISSEGEILSTEAEINIPSGDNEPCSVLVSFPGDVALNISLEAKAVY